mgnify:CR=1 FL=1
MEKIWLSSPTMHGEEQAFVKEAFDSNWVAPLGENVNEFEKEVAAYVGCRSAVAMTAGTHALHMCFKVAGVGEGDIVLCSDLTFAATANPVTYVGGKLVFIDSERETWNMNPKLLEKALETYGDKVRAVAVVNLYGTPAKLDEICALCDKYHVILIEDAAESLSAKYKGKQTGGFGKYNAISFNGNKIITSSGGGMFLSDDAEAAEKVRFYSTQSREKVLWYQHSEIGYNYRMSNVLAGIGRGQMVHLDEHRAMKKRIYDTYREGFRGCPVEMNPYLACSEPNFWLSCITIGDTYTGKVTPETLRLALEKENIESRPIWKPMHMQPVFADCDFVTADDGCVSEDIFARGLCLPSDIKMTSAQQQKVIEIIKRCFDV